MPRISHIWAHVSQLNSNEMHNAAKVFSSKAFDKGSYHIWFFFVVFLQHSAHCAVELHSWAHCAAFLGQLTLHLLSAKLTHTHTYNSRRVCVCVCVACISHVVINIITNVHVNLCTHTHM